MFENRALTPEQVAARLQMSEDRVVRWLNAGQLRGLRFDDHWWTSTLFLATFLDAHANRPALRPVGAGGRGRLYPFKRRGRA